MTATAVEPQERYTCEQLVNLTGATYRQIWHWIAQGFIEDPRPESMRTSGRSLSFDRDVLDTVQLVVRLLHVGFRLDRSFAIARQLIDHDGYRVEFGDIWQLVIAVNPTPARPTEEPA